MWKFSNFGAVLQLILESYTQAFCTKSLPINWSTCFKSRFSNILALLRFLQLNSAQILRFCSLAQHAETLLSLVYYMACRSWSAIFKMLYNLAVSHTVLQPQCAENTFCFLCSKVWHAPAAKPLTLATWVIK